MSIRPLPDPPTSHPGPPAAPREVRTLRNPDDLLALVPTLFGFHPHDSLVLVGVGAAPGMHARVDLPTGPDAAREVAGVLAHAAGRADCEAACLLGYSEDRTSVVAAVEATAAALDHVGIPVALAVHADGGTYVLLHADGDPGPATPYDVSGHPLMAEAVVAGRVVHADRGSLVESLRPVPRLVADVQRHADTCLDVLGSPEEGRAAPTRATLLERLQEEARWVNRLTRTLLAADALPTTAQAARMLVAMRVSLTARDALWAEISPGHADRAVRLCRHLVQVAPRDLRAAPAALLGFAAWLSGDGALAWCGVEASQAAESGYSMAALVGELLERAVPPTSWTPWARSELGVPGLD
ncbi:DUF4192 domain-containing protein [Nocardioides massiliensis]|uniref:DUF4192 domain-containing protein n=1 Tax=Nocardioides massiliensis TaxID=1325935 RepID=A0ABT9NTS8_9ACTN|nr:DUF4192 domain-containing protein [Nocardioides massiliensis]MDP9823440.1 hypothetical protein [Nocardioides massiliensis]